MPGGVNFALYSETAQSVELLLFDDDEGPPTATIPVPDRTRFVFHAFVPGIGVGQRYGYRVTGPLDPDRGLRFDSTTVLFDPYAKAFTPKRSDGIPSRCLVVDERFDWQGDDPLDHPLERLVIYEVHVKGFTAHPSSGASYPGTYLGFIDKIPYLARLGVNAVQLLPVHEHLTEEAVRRRGLTNYWGYNSIGFFAPESSYSTGASPGCQVVEFKTMVRALHRAGIEVILDVAYNHTAEGDEHGPTLSFRGIDNPTYYVLTGPPNAPGRHYLDLTGCGNTFDLTHPAVIRLVMDSLRYWVETMHVDGFRFDLATVLGRHHDVFDRTSGFFDAIAQDPILSRVKLIAEPWDVDEDEIGNFPVDWCEWNGRFRDTARRFGKGDSNQLADLGWRLTGSADLYGDDGRTAANSINFVTCHDGFTLNDLVSYSRKHNEANGQGNRDGIDANDSWNWGTEGESRDPATVALRERLMKNYFCLLLFSAGTPLILGGDELARTQRGNNNAYCQDNETSWFDWNLATTNAGLVEFVRKAIALTGRYPVLERRRFLLGQALPADHLPDLRWFGPSLDEPAWNDPEARFVALLLDGLAEEEPTDDYLLFLVFNAGWEARSVAIPPPKPGMRWFRVVDTALRSPDDFLEDHGRLPPVPADAYPAQGRSTVVLLARRD